MEQRINEFMEELHKRTGGDKEHQVSMYDIGDSLGLDKNDVSSLSQELMIEEWIELKTLSGAITITSTGLAAMGLEDDTQGGDDNTPRLSGKEILNREDQALVQGVLQTIRSRTCTSDASIQSIEPLIIDIKTLDLQLLSPSPPLPVIRALLLSLRTRLDNIGLAKDAAVIENLLP